MPNLINLFIDKFRGVRAVNPIVDVVNNGEMSALSCKNVELHYSRNGNNVGIYTMKGNREIAELPGKTIRGMWESVQGGVKHSFVYATDEGSGYLYEYKSGSRSFILLKDGLTRTRTCNATTIAQGLVDFFVFTNGVDDYIAVDLSAELDEDRVKFLGAVDAEKREIRGLALEYYDGRLVTICKNRVHWCQVGNIFNWSAATTGYTTNAAYQEFDRDVVAIAFYNNTLVAFTDSYSVCFSGNPADVANFRRSGSTGGGCAGYQSVIRFDNKLFYYDHMARNVFAYYLYDSGQTRPTDGLANNIKTYFDMVDANCLDEIAVQGFTVEDRTEVWFKLPIKSNETLVLILDYLKNEWVVRDVQGMDAMMLYDNGIYTAAGSKIYKEYMSNTFNGEFRPCEYLMNIINVGSDSNLKIPKLPIIFTFDSKYTNNFYIEFTYDDKPEKKKIKKISKGNDKFLTWAKLEDDPEGGYWAEDENDELGGLWGRDDSLNVTYSLAGTLPFKQLQMRIFTEDPNDEFGIKRIEMKKVKIKTKTVM